MTSSEPSTHDLAPVAHAEAAAPAAAAAPAPAPAAVKRRGKTPLKAAPAAPAPPLQEPPPPVFVGGRPRAAVIDLDFPVSYDGRTFDKVMLRRPTSGEVAAFFQTLATEGFTNFPVFFTPEGEPIPFAVINALDPDDDDKLGERIMEFVPRRLLAPGLDAAGSASVSGEPAAPTT
jgi:hypothetical protein